MFSQLSYPAQIHLPSHGASHSVLNPITPFINEHIFPETEPKTNLVWIVLQLRPPFPQVTLVCVKFTIKTKQTNCVLKKNITPLVCGVRVCVQV